MKPAKIGSVSHGTLRLEDLIPCFAYLLEDLQENGEAEDIIDSAETWATEDPEGSDYFERGGWILEDLFNALEEAAPPYCYFGANEGAGADFGFWPSWDSLDEISHVADTCELATMGGSDCLHVSDHGNATLYSWDGTDWREVWAIV